MKNKNTGNNKKPPTLNGAPSIRVSRARILAAALFFKMDLDSNFGKPSQKLRRLYIYTYMIYDVGSF